MVMSDKCMGVPQLLRGKCPGCPPKIYAYASFVSIMMGAKAPANGTFCLAIIMYCQTLVFKQAPIRGILHNISSLRYCDLSDTIGYFRQADNTLSLVSSQVETLSTFAAGYL